MALAVLAAGALGAGYWGATRFPKRFAVVAPGRLYRSGEVSGAQLERVQRTYGIKRVICLLNEAAPVTRAEQEAAERLGLEWRNVSLPGNGASTPAERAQLVALLADESAPPTLVHCAAGVNRTGLAVGLFRLHCQKWSLEQVMAELRATDFEDRPEHENLRQALAEEAARLALHSVSGR